MPSTAASPAVPARSQAIACSKAAWTLLRHRLLLVIVVTVTTQGIYAWAVLPLLLMLFQAALSAAGVDGLSQTSLLGLLGNPLSLLALILVILLATFFALLEICVFTVIVQLCFHGESPSISPVLRGLGRIGRRAMSWQIILFAGYALLVIPLSHIGVGSALTSHIAIPKFVSGEITKTLPGSIAYVLVVISLIYLGLRLAGTAAALSDEERTVLDAMRRSMALTKRTQIHIVVVTLAVGAAAVLVFFMAALLGAVPVALSASGGAGAQMAGSMLAVLKLVQFIGTGIAAAFLAFFFVALLCGGQLAPPREVPAPDRISRVSAAVVLTLFVILATPPTVFATLAAQPSASPLVIAHRGYTAGGVENTIESLRAAAAAGADVVEMDIQETADQKFVVIHDVGLKRLAGDPRSVYELTQAELTGVVVRQDGLSGHIPTLEDYLHTADELGIRVLVEVKPHGHEAPGFAKRVVQVMDRLDPTRNHMIQSLDAGIVEAIVSADPGRDVVLVTGFQLGNAPRTGAAGVAIEDWSYSDEMLVNLHDDRKRLFVWTVNDSALINEYLGKGVDGIITDRVAEAVTTRQLQETIKNPLSRYLNQSLRDISGP
ncbi:glycerophosphoryl diester phosphodiesterase membrane domain-containing protein [Arthrobacter sp. GMC3]|uniref:glycerophosphoryl diester phosphodiesterase membrane domain-containing protein n=1 Tax=Arthrobacter sp. GMC3 TaxID=2058894 RepID=UPI000CE3793A|nr:glycerophosphoryl diester phosphodiesterase membrane domain-containing protein [Arthrobacter sp. GMC3]